MIFATGALCLKHESCCPSQLSVQGAIGNTSRNLSYLHTLPNPCVLDHPAKQALALVVVVHLHQVASVSSMKKPVGASCCVPAAMVTLGVQTSTKLIYGQESQVAQLFSAVYAELFSVLVKSVTVMPKSTNRCKGPDVAEQGKQFLALSWLPLTHFWRCLLHLLAQLCFKTLGSLSRRIRRHSCTVRH